MSDVNLCFKIYREKKKVILSFCIGFIQFWSLSFFGFLKIILSVNLFY